MREAKEDAQNRRRGGYSSYSRRNQRGRDGYKRQYGYSFRGRSDGSYGRYDQRRGEKVNEEGSRIVFAGMMREPVTTVGKLDISGHSGESRRMESEDSVTKVELNKSSVVLYEKSDEINNEEKLVVDEAERK